MPARLRSRWLKIKKHPFIATGTILVLIALIAFIFAAYRFSWSGTGFLNKTLWDWLQLLIIPLVLAVAALLFNLANSRTERHIAKQRYEQDQQIAKQRYKQDQQIALDKQREDLLQTYLDRMSELLLEKNLRTSSTEEVRNVARVRTITILFQLDARRIRYVFAFLRESGLMSTKPNSSIVSLTQADLRKINLSEANLEQADLRGVDLREANLTAANLEQVDLSGADLHEADLRRAKITEKQLKEAKSVKGTILPDGSKHT